MRKIKIVLMVIYILLFSALALTAQPVIEAKIESDAYKVGDIIPLKIDISDNPGLHSIFFDIEYNGSVLAFDSIEKGLMVRRITDENTLLYAVADDVTANSIGNHVIITFSQEDKVLTQETGNFITLRFRVIDDGEPDDSYLFSFNNNGVKDQTETLIDTAEWIDSDSFQIISSTVNSFIQIRNPYDNQVFYTDSASIDAIFTDSTDYYVILENSDTGYISDEIDAAAGSISGETVPIGYGFNRIKASLYETGSNELLAQDTVRILRSDDDVFIKIISPGDHELLNTDMVEVRVTSPFDNVMINGALAEDTGEKDGDNYIFRSRLWLKSGFNSINASCESSEGAVFTDSISVYYYKDNTIFRYVEPANNEVFKTGSNVLLNIKGEIGSQYKSQGVPNTVTLKVIYYPDNPLLSTRILVNNVNAKITETDIVTGTSRAPYMFINDFDIPLNNLDSGEIEIIAYKNKTGTVWEDEIHRIIRVDSNELAINLVQPNVYSQDILNTLKKLEGFNSGILPDLNALQLNDDGSFALKETVKLAKKADSDTNKVFGDNVVADIIETDDKTLYALVNENFGMKIYKKVFGSNEWIEELARDDIYGYDICETDLGILIGVSNLFTSGYTGLYLLNDENKLINISIGEPIANVQFIVNNEGEIYLYGNDYSHLYSFSIFSLEDDNGSLTTSAVTKVPFDNNMFLNQFELGEDGKTAVLRDTNNKVYFYENDDDEGFNQVTLDASKFDAATSFIQVIRGDYTDGDYNAYLLVPETVNSLVVVMEQKSTHRLLVNTLDYEELSFGTNNQVLGIGFKDDNFIFLFKQDDGRFVFRKAQVLFDELFEYGEDEVYENNCGEITISNLRLFTSSNDIYYLGIGSDIDEEKRDVYQFVNEYESYGYCDLNYINEDIEGITGFQFEVDSIWITEEGIDFGFKVYENNVEIVNYTFENASLIDFIDKISNYYEIVHEYDSSVGKEVVRVEFNELLEDKTLSFYIGIQAKENNSPALGNLTVNKKIPVKIPITDDKVIYLPIHGYIQDSTVEKAYINEVVVSVERNRSFSYNYPILSSKSVTPITISCTNSIGEYTELSFNVEIFESKNNIWDVSFEPLSTDIPVSAKDYELYTENDTLYVSGYYYGLIGATAGYELYDYVYDDDGNEELVLIRNGIFGNYDNNFESFSEMPEDWTLPGEDESAPGSGYEYGHFTDQEIELVPGKQLLKIFVENPGGLRKEYMITEDNYPHIIYNLPADEQEILIRNLGITEIEEPYTEEDVVIDKSLELTVYESSDLHFKRTYTIEGEVKSLYNFTDLKIKSLNPEVTFDNGDTEIIVDVDKINRFMVDINIYMDDIGEAGVYDLLFIPTKPVFQWMRTGLRIEAVKDFRNTYIIPEFDLMDDWTEDELKAGKKLLKIKIQDNRYIPEDSQVRLITNFTTEISGYLSEIEPGQGIYKVKDKTSKQDLYLEGVKPGCNRVQWWISYSNGLISTSTSGKSGMTDYIFYLPDEVETIATEINFPIKLQTYYNNTDGSAEQLPDFELIKDISSTVIVYLNNEVIWEDSGEEESFIIDSWDSISLREGKNYIEVYNSEDVKVPETFNYEFLYDTMNPEIAIDSYRFDDEYNYLLELSALVTETNLDRVELYYEDDSALGISRIDAPVEVLYIGEDMYTARWYNLGQYFIDPTENYKVVVKVRDHSGKYNETDVEFTGLKDISRPEKPYKEKVDISGYMYRQNGILPYFDDDGDDPYNGHIRFYNSSVSLLNISAPTYFRHERYEDIFIGNTGESNYNGEIILKAGTTINFEKGFEIKKGATLDSGIVSVGVKENYEPPAVSFYHKEESDGMTFLFQFRDDFEPYYETNNSIYRRVLTILDDDSEDLSIYIGIKDDEDRFYIVKEAPGLNGNIECVDLIDLNNIDPDLVTYDSADDDDWNTINVAIQNLESRIYLSVNDKEQIYVEIPALDYCFDDMLDQDAEYYFGSKDVSQTGHFSIARVFYINEIVETSTALEALTYTEEGLAEEEEPYRTYNFLSEADDVGTKYFELRPENDHFSPYENANYSEDSSRGCLKVCKEQKNILCYQKDSGVYFADTEKPLLINLDADYTVNNGESIEIKPKSNLFSGKYFFGNKFGTHDLLSNRWYSISGNIRSIGEGTDTGNEDQTVKLIMRIDNREQSIVLKEGEFHFVYENDTSETLYDVVVYIETDKKIVFDKNIIFNEGNYKLPAEGVNGLAKSRATTKYIFFPKGTIDFWYKPFNVNNEGYVSYNAVLFDGGYVQIGAKIKSGEEFAKYYVELNNNTTFFEHSDVLVKEGWQHIQFTYSRDDDVAYLYIDGKMAIKYEGDPSGTLLPEPPGVTPNVDNVYLGSDDEGRFLAQGYLDEIQFSNLYYDSKYDSKVYDPDSESGGKIYHKYNPISVEYTDEPQPALSIELNDSSYNVTDIEYCLDAKDRFFRQITKPGTVSDHGFDIANIPSGAYLLRIKMVINGHRFRKTYYFVKDNRPMFEINEYTPIIITGVSSDISFNLEYDGSYLLNSKDSVFAGFAIRIKGTYINSYNLEEEFVETYYVTQDYIHQNKYNKKWYIIDEEGIERGSPWSELELDENTIDVVFSEIVANSDIEWDFRSFYIEEQFNEEIHLFDNLESEKSGTIANANFTAEIMKVKYGTENDSGSSSDEEKEYEYMIDIQIGSAGNGSGGILEEMGIHYMVTHEETGESNSGIVNLNGANNTALYYDDILPEGLYGTYECVLSLMYQGEAFGEKPSMTLVREKVLNVLTPEEEKYLDIADFSLVYLDKVNDKAKLYLEYNQNNIASINYDLTVISTDTGDVSYQVDAGSLNPEKTFILFNDIDVSEGACYIKLKVYSDEDGIVSTSDLQVVNSAVAPTIALTNTVDSLISYNNVMFSWKGYHEGIYKSDIEYTYNFDDKGWTAPTSDWKKLELYNLDEGYHNFKVKAVYNGEESSEESVTFFVDVNRPIFDESKITVEKIYDDDGIPYAVNIYGDEEAIVESSLTEITINETSITLGVNGSFAGTILPLEYDGENTFTISAYDRVGNFTDYEIIVDNPITSILYPDLNDDVLYSPMTVVGEISDDINVDVDIYLFDPMSEDKGENDYTGWREAKINEDRKFFIEDVYITPGTEFVQTHTPLDMRVIVRSGTVFKRTVDVWANQILMPIEMELSTHAVEGETAETEVEINCTANVDDISSWSIDYDGDGIYDTVDMVDNPDLGKTHSWAHTYSSLGLVKPRVRVITNDGNYFSVTDQIIIHEEIKEASNTIITNPISMTSVLMDDNSQRIFVLAGVENNFRIEAFEVGRNETYISDRLFNISLEGLGIDNPVAIKAFDENNLFIASNRNGRGTVYLLKANDFGNYLMEADADFEVNDEIKHIDCDNSRLFISLVSMNYIVSVPLVDGLPDETELEYNEPEMPSGDTISSNIGISKDDLGLLACDFYNQRILRLSDSFNVIEFTGSFGNGEGEFLKPSIIKSYENRIFIYDEGRNDIQVFDPGFNSITKISYDIDNGDENYLAAGFLDDIAGIEVLTKEENNIIYYYALLLSRQEGKLAMLKLPQWEELRARVRSNKIVFLKDKEVLCAKPTGSDLAKIITTDSIPRIEGTVDYPSISPDGRKIVFTSRIELYDKTGEFTGEGGNIYAYDNLYIMDMDGENLQRIPLGSINHYEIERPVFSSNGDLIIFSAKETGKNWQIYIYDINEGSITQLFETDENTRFPYFSPDDRYIVFTTDYDGDEEIEIVDTQNINVRVSVTSNDCRDSYPVWSRVYPYEISNTDLDITSKIGFVSERNYHKGVYYLYISTPHESDVRIVTKNGEETGGDPDSAAIEITDSESEGDYPCFTGNAEEIVYEYYDGYEQILRKYNYEEDLVEKMNLPAGARKPAGMKNSITNFTVESINGNDVSLEWTPYVDTEVFYTLQYKINSEGETAVQKKVFTDGSAVLQGFTMGVEYLFKVSLVENGIEEAATSWKEVKIPEVAAIPSYTIDSDNPYLVNFHAWKPDDDTDWNFIWIIDNQEIDTAQTSQDLAYEFGTSGLKIVQLKATNKSNTETAISDAVFITINSDIIPVIEYSLIDNDTTYIELNAENSAGSKIDLSSAEWTISGPGSDVIKKADGSKVIISLDDYKHKVNVNLKLSRKAVTGQTETDVIEKNIIVDLDLKDVKPVITYELDEKNDRLFYFSGNYSLGNIDWYRAKWNVYSDGQVIYTESGLSSFAYEFPETSEETNYSVSLSIPRVSDGLSETTSVMISVEAAPIEPVIDYEILELMEDGNVVGAKILLSCSGSKGNNIDFSSAMWCVPVASNYDEQPTQIGPTAIYNLFSGDNTALVEVSLTLTKVGGTDAVTVTDMIQLKNGETAETEIIVNKIIEENEDGNVLFLDILSSTGPNINWEETEWIIDSEYTRTGPSVRYDIPTSSEDVVFKYVVTVYRYGTNTPIIKRGEIIIDKSMILPFISAVQVEGGSGNVYELSVTETPGTNIDWDSTLWYIYDGNEDVQVKQGAQIIHTFVQKEEAFGYPVMVEMFYEGSSKPFVGYTSVDVEGDELIPVITWDMPAERGDENVVNFTAQNSSGSNIDWSNCKWTFGDSSESQYGPTAVHEYPVDSTSREYRVSLTIVRNLSNGETETETAYKTIEIGSDEITPVIRARMMSTGYLVLSAEESEGRGLLLDRSLWIFEGEGDTETLSINEKTGTIKNESYTDSESEGWNVGASETAGVNAQTGPFASATATEGYNSSDSSSNTVGATTYDDYKDMTQTFSSSNEHTGAVCRKYVVDYDTSQGEWTSDSVSVITVTLFVYRVDADSGMTGRSITVRVDLDEASEGNGAVYK